MHSQKVSKITSVCSSHQCASDPKVRSLARKPIIVGSTPFIFSEEFRQHVDANAHDVGERLRRREPLHHGHPDARLR